MKYIKEFRDSQLLTQLSNYIHKIVKKPITIMEVCGSHTNSIHRFGIHDLLPENITLTSGPGCPVCVTAIDFIDKAISLTHNPNTIIATFGDLLKVPGSTSTLEKERGKGKDIRIVFSIDEALEISKCNSDKEIVFLAIGFETTAPSTAAGIIKAKHLQIHNFSILSAHKVMPPAMRAIIDDGIPIDGFLAPGHVSVITGAEMYMFIPKNYRKGVVISGFEPIDILQSIIMLVNQHQLNDPKVEIQYTRVVKPQGNVKAQQIMSEVFEYSDDTWRGLGNIPLSALKLKSAYVQYDAENKFQINREKSIEPKGCICGLILKGLNKPFHCPLYRKLCTPDNPIGACMVSYEGACNVYYRYN